LSVKITIKVLKNICHHIPICAFNDFLDQLYASRSFCCLLLRYFAISNDAHIQTTVIRHTTREHLDFSAFFIHVLCWRPAYLTQ